MTTVPAVLFTTCKMSRSVEKSMGFVPRPGSNPQKYPNVVLSGSMTVAGVINTQNSELEEIIGRCVLVKRKSCDNLLNTGAGYRPYIAKSNAYGT